jgi:hypothetical protein
VLHQPCAGQWPICGSGIDVLRCGIAMEIGDVMGTESLGVVHILGRIFSRPVDFVNQGSEWLVQFSRIW